MVLYSVRWIADSSLTKGKGRVKDKESYITFTVLCRTSQDAVTCLEWVYKDMFPGSKFSIQDGVISLTRSIIDSRGFHPTYLLCDGLKKPLKMSNVKDSLLDYYHL